MSYYLSQFTTEQLAEWLAEGLERQSEAERCDNGSDYLCCHDCGVPYYRSEIETRLYYLEERPTQNVVTRVLTVERARELGLI